MTDEEFNLYLREHTRRKIASVCDDDARIELHSGMVMLVSHDGERMIPLLPRDAAAIAIGVEEAYAELERRYFLDVRGAR